MAANFKGIELNCAPEWEEFVSLKMQGNSKWKQSSWTPCFMGIIIGLWRTDQSYCFLMGIKNKWMPKRIPSRIGVPRKWQCSVPEDRLKSGIQSRDSQGTSAWCLNVSWEVCPFSPEDLWGASLLAPKMLWRTQLFSPPVKEERASCQRFSPDHPQRPWIRPYHRVEKSLEDAA